MVWYPVQDSNLLVRLVLGNGRLLRALLDFLPDSLDEP
jgi:hypothetical protein